MIVPAISCWVLGEDKTTSRSKTLRSQSNLLMGPPPPKLCFSILEQATITPASSPKIVLFQFWGRSGGGLCCRHLDSQVRGAFYILEMVQVEEQFGMLLDGFDAGEFFHTPEQPVLGTP